MPIGKHFQSPDHIEIGGPTWPHDPLIFLAGPIQGAADWQAEAAKIIHRIEPSIHVANPRRPIRSLGDFTEAMYNEQVDWEHRYLDYASKNGIVMFWLANEREHDCARAYAQTTRFELGEHFTLHRLGHARIAVGYDDKFTGAKYLRRTAAKKSPDLTLQTSLEATCQAAVDGVLERYRASR